MVAEGNVGVAFAMTAAAGMATTLGACIVWCASLAQPRLLAGSLGFAAGVMLYVSFAEIFLRKSVAAFENISDPNAAYRWSTLCFFGGMLIIIALDKLVHAVVHLGARHATRKAGRGGGAASTSTANLLSHEDQAAAAPAAAPGGQSMRRLRRPSAQAADVEATGSAACTPRAGAGDAAVAPSNGSSESLCGHAGEGSQGGDSSSDDLSGGLSAPVALTEPCDAMTSAVVAASCPNTVAGPEGDSPAGEAGQAGGTASRTPPAVVEIMEADHHAFMLKKMGLLTALALFIHNFPEGLATFVGALADTKIGAGLAVAIAMHNIPEGICVAMPIYYATGSKWKGFWWAFLSGVSEPIGALVGYLALSGDSTDMSFAIVFGLVAGMMVYISVKELVPTALRYDPQDTVVTTCVIAGMVIMAASLLLFTL